MKNITSIIISALLITPTITILAGLEPVRSTPLNPIAQQPNIDPADQQEFDRAEAESPAKVKQIAKDITVRITSANNGDSGVLIAKKGNTYLVLTNAHVTRRANQFQLQAPDGQKYTAKVIDGGFDRKYDLALLEFTTPKQYQLASLANPGILKPNDRNIYSVGFPFDSKDLRISPGEITQLSDIPFDNGTQIGYEIAKGEKGVRQGMSGGPIFDRSGVFLGINTIGAAPILPNYTYNDGSKPLAKLAAKYRNANWGIPVYNFLIQVKPDLLYGYKFDGLAVGKIQRQATLTGYMAKLNDTARKQTVRIENNLGNGSGVIIAREGTSYYVLTAKHVVENQKTQQPATDLKIITYDQDNYQPTSTVVATGLDLAVVKFTSQSNYPIAQLGQYSPNTNDIVLAGGFPGRDKINSPLWQWQLNPGYIFDPEQGKFQAQDKNSFAKGGYDLIYTNISYGGMSGGAVFDTAGRVVGIHGQAETTEKAENLLGSSQGISIQTFIGIADKLKIKPQLLKIANNPPAELNATNRWTIITAMRNLTPPQPGDDGERWLAYGNQLFRTAQYDESVAAFDLAIAKGKGLTGNYGRALSLFYAGKYELAETAIARAIAAVPANKRANYYYFWKYQSASFSRLAKYDDALKAINIAIELEPNDPILRNEKAAILSRSKKYIEAIAIYTDLIRTKPEAYAYNNRGNAKSALGNKQEAISDFERALALDPKSANAYNNRGIAKSALGNKQEAISDYDRALAIDPKFSMAYNNRGVAKSELGNQQGAIGDFERAIKINPNDAAAYVGRGSVQLLLGDKQGAGADLSKGAELFRQQGQMDTYQKVMEMIAQLKGQGAIADRDRAIKINPNDAIAYIETGQAKSERGDKKGAIADYDRAIKINPNLSDAYSSRGAVKSALGDNNGAISDYDRAIKINPNDAAAYIGRGGVKVDVGDRQGAIADLSKGAELCRQQGQMDYYQKVMDMIAQLKGQGAIADRDRAIKTNPNDAIAYIEQGQAKLERGDNQGAIADFDRAIKINPNFDLAYAGRGNAKLALGDNNGAISDYDRAIKINPNFPAAYIGRGTVKLALADKQEAIADLSRGAELFRKQGQMDLYQQVMGMIAKLKGS